MNKRFAAVLAVAASFVLVVACTDDYSVFENGGAEDASGDATSGPDGGLDSSYITPDSHVADATSDGAGDATLDGPVDGTTDAPSDAPTDGAEDAPSDGAGDAADAQPDAAPVCGAVGEPCCTGAACPTSGVCAANTCVECGVLGQACCSGATPCTTSGACCDSTANQCVGSGSACLGGEVCTGGSCTSCGTSSTSPCCAGN